jgi:hypothetical protein
MKATLTKTAHISSRRSRPGRSIAYVNSPLDQVADEFATEYEIWDLPFKSKTWTSICNEVSKITAGVLKQLFAGATSIKFSYKAGCSCGCSPGYIVKYDSYRDGLNHWVDIEASAEELAELRASLFSLRRISALRKEKEDKLLPSPPPAISMES